MALFFLYLILVALTNGQNIPKSGPTEYGTSFSCVGRVTGYYADVESGCQLYHLCDADGRRFTHSCPNATLFQQRMMICDHWYMVDCSKSVRDYKANLLIGQRDKPFVGDDHNHHREPVHFFTVSQNHGSLQQPNWFPLVHDRTKQESEDLDNTVPNLPATVSSIHIGYRPSNNAATDSPYPAQRQARNRNFVPEHGLLGRHALTETSSPRPLDVEASPSRPQGKLPEAYANNPFFQSLVSTTPLPEVISRVQINLEVQTSKDQKTTNLKVQPQTEQKPIYIEVEPRRDRKLVNLDVLSKPVFSRPPVQLEDIANVRISSPQTFQQQSSSRRTKEFPFQGSRVQNLPPHLREHKIPDFEHSGRLAADDDVDNIVELHLLDPRRMFYIPESRTHDIERGNSTVLHISVPTTPSSNNKRSHGLMHFKNDVTPLEGHNPQCPKCHPAFLIPGRCHPCVIIR